jgi:hypothetical protein
MCLEVSLEVASLSVDFLARFEGAYFLSFEDAYLQEVMSEQSRNYLLHSEQ